MSLFASPLFAFMEGLGGMEMLLVMVVVLVLFGGEKLPEFARGAGKLIREFKKASSGVEEEFKRALEEDERKKVIAAAAAATPALADPVPPATTAGSTATESTPALPTSEPPAPTMLPPADLNPTSEGYTGASTTEPVPPPAAPATPPASSPAPSNKPPRPPRMLPSDDELGL
jgi:TatA/E family protein of Tat protein translocase